jgi:hypothetical protein
MADKDPGYTLGDEHGFALSDNILAAIGLTVVCLSYLEHNIASAIIRLADMPSHRGLMMTSGMSFRALRSALDGLILESVKHGSTEAEKYKAIMTRINGFENFRNQVAHSLWATSREDVTKALRVKMGTSKSGFRAVQTDIDTSAISKSIKEVNAALRDLMEFVESLIAKRE